MLHVPATEETIIPSAVTAERKIQFVLIENAKIMPNKIIVPAVNRTCLSIDQTRPQPSFTGCSTLEVDIIYLDLDRSL